LLLSDDQLRTAGGNVALVDGCFDPLHAGHVRYFRAAKALGFPLICKSAPDSYIVRKHPVLLSATRRAALLDSLDLFDGVYVGDLSTADVLERLRPTRYVKGSEWRGKLPEAEQRICADCNIEIVYIDQPRDSSSEIMSTFVSSVSATFPEIVANFEQAVAAQRIVEPDHYNEEYFLTNWREAGNSYQLDVRREIEGKNPALIKEVLQPASLLDVGCGPGSLMFFLNEIGVNVTGVDFSEHCKRIAPAEVQERISIATTDILPFEARSFDVVLSREVFEHLTVTQLFRTVAEMCRVSNRLIYVTTRYHPEPASLLDFTTQFEVDPSHITLMSKDFVRALFVGFGFRTRADLESRMDWMNKGRVLVMERVEPA
jgi:2-polyprenyl-3-methyl-5-hydroxy-6-metoxy-1,4-benzoquinol methylase/glycerol-3-phosphate cytidylyltransferase-like family protein